MMSETVVTMDGSSNNASNNPRQVPTVKTEPGQPNPLAGIRLNVDYFKTIPGILKLIQLVSCSRDSRPFKIFKYSNIFLLHRFFFLFIVLLFYFLKSRESQDENIYRQKNETLKLFERIYIIKRNAYRDNSSFPFFKYLYYKSSRKQIQFIHIQFM
ncbi:hypothetical protein P5V15_005913 [Pogonomyrmex californicus]